MNLYHYNMFDVILVEKVAVGSVNGTYNFLDTVKMQKSKIHFISFQSKNKLKLFQVSYVGELLLPVIVKNIKTVSPIKCLNSFVSPIKCKNSFVLPIKCKNSVTDKTLLLSLRPLHIKTQKSFKKTK
jgi:hypothetical protein